MLLIAACTVDTTAPLRPPPTLTQVTPAVGPRGTTVGVTITGTEFTPGVTTLSVSGTGVAVSTFLWASRESATAQLVIDATAVTGDRELVIKTNSGESAAQTFKVLLAVPTVAEVAPATGVRGNTVAVTLTGTDFVAGGTTVAVSGTGITVSGVSVTNATTLTADLAIAADAPIGARTLTVTTVSGTSGAATFTVNPVTPAVTNVSPAAGVRGNTVAVTLTGTNFIAGATTVAVSGSDVTVSNVSVASETSLTADFAIGGSAALGGRDVTVTTAGGTSAAQTFTVNPPTPTLTAVSPTVGVRGNTVAVTLTGTNFVSGGTTVAVSGSDVTVSNVSVASGTSLTVDFAIGSSAALGSRTVSVTTAGGTSGTQSFTINPLGPTLTAVSPTAGVQGTTVAVTLTGTNFVSGATIAVSGSNVSVSNVSVASGTSLTADFAIGSSAALGARTVTVTTSGGTTGTQTFTVNPPAPTLTAISPTAGVQGNTIAVTLTGTNFVSGATVAVSGSNVTVSNVDVVSATSLTADFAIASGAALGDRNVTVTTAGGTTAAKTLTVNPPAPTLTAVSPATGVQGNTVAVTLTGTNFVAGTTVSVSGSNVTVSNVSVVSATSLTADFAIASGAALGDRNVTVTTAGGTTAAKTFTVNPPPPTLSAVSPTTGVQATTVAVTLTGTNFVSGSTTVAVSGLNVTVQNVSVSSGTSLTADFVIASGAALGDRNVTVTTAGGTTAAKSFTVNPPAPTLTGVTPTSGVQGTTVTVTLTGTNFIAGATTVAVSGSNVTVQNVSVSSGTSLSVQFVIGSTAAAGARNVTVTTAGGTSGAQTFTMTSAADPQEIPITP